MLRKSCGMLLSENVHKGNTPFNTKWKGDEDVVVTLLNSSLVLVPQSGTCMISVLNTKQQQQQLHQFTKLFYALLVFF
jgi:hypothetical protein